MSVLLVVGAVDAAAEVDGTTREVLVDEWSAAAAVSAPASRIYEFMQVFIVILNFNL